LTAYATHKNFQSPAYQGNSTYLKKISDRYVFFFNNTQKSPRDIWA